MSIYALYFKFLFMENKKDIMRHETSDLHRLNRSVNFTLWLSWVNKLRSQENSNNRIESVCYGSFYVVSIWISQPSSPSGTHKFCSIGKPILKQTLSFFLAWCRQIIMAFLFLSFFLSYQALTFMTRHKLRIST